MAFESLSHRHTFRIKNFPDRWLPLICLYDADLPLFPIYYFHALTADLPSGKRPGEADRIFGYVEKINLTGTGYAEITVITNKNPSDSRNSDFLATAENEVRERFGVNNSVTHADIASTFMPPFDSSNQVLSEIWHRVVTNAYGNMLPFGRLWDETLGLARFVASWNSPGGRKSELIQTHYFMSKFGVRIQASGDVPQVDFYLAPTIHELTDLTNPLSLFPAFSKLAKIANLVQSKHCETVAVDDLTLSKFNNPVNGETV